MAEKDILNETDSSKLAVKKSAIPRKKGIWEQVKPDFNKDFTAIAVHLIKDVAEPALLDTLYNLGINFISTLIYGDKGNTQRSASSSGNSPRLVNYADRYRPFNNQPVQRSSVYDYTELEYNSRYDAEVALYRMKEILATSQQRCVTVGDYIEVSQDQRDPNRIRPTSVDYDYGWTNLDGVDFKPSRSIRDENGTLKTLYYLTLPRPMPLER